MNRHTFALSADRTQAVIDIGTVVLANYRAKIDDSDAIARDLTAYDILVVMGLLVGATEETAKMRSEVLAVLRDLP